MVTFIHLCLISSSMIFQGRIQWGGGTLKLEKIWFFGVKSWFFTRNTPKIFAPPSARPNFFKCTPLTWNAGSAPAFLIKDLHKKLLRAKNITSHLVKNTYYKILYIWQPKKISSRVFLCREILRCHFVLNSMNIICSLSILYK